MPKNLVIVESPAKAKTIEKFLGKDFVVKSCFGHIRDLPKDSNAIDLKNGYKPKYVVPADKKAVVKELKKLADEAETVWLASDEDREGEAISWHLADELNLDIQTTKRIVFHEITKNAILKAIDNPRTIDMNLVDAQQARRILDRIVGFELSPVLWKKVRPSLSAGRVQSVAVRLIVEREKEIGEFNVQDFFKVKAEFSVKDRVLHAELPKKFEKEEEVEKFLQSCTGATFTVNRVEVKPAVRKPAAPFTTSTLQQEASRKLGYSVSRTMTLAQRLYEEGHITYMRTDSVNLSDFARTSAKSAIESQFGSQYSQARNFTTKNSSAQEAHEAIRPTSFEVQQAGSDDGQRRLYDLIWKRSIASQMSDAQLEKTQVGIENDKNSEIFQAEGEVIKFDGFLKVYLESTDDEESETGSGLLPPMSKGDVLPCRQIVAQQRYTRPPARYTEASLVKKMEELGIGRPSTYAPTITTIMKRGYVLKEKRDGEERKFVQLIHKNGLIEKKILSEITGAEKDKLTPSDIGRIVTEFLIEHFSKILDYQFTAKVEKEFDDIASGLTAWSAMIDAFYHPFHQNVDKTLDTAEKATGEKELGKHPQTGKPVFVKIGRFGPMVQIGLSTDEEKPVFASIPKGVSMDDINLEEALKLFDLPRELGKFEEKVVKANVGRFGPFVQHDSKYVSLTKEDDPYTVTLDRAIELIEQKRKTDAARLIRTFTEDPAVQVLNGRYGPYIAKGKENYRIPKGTDPESLDFAMVTDIMKNQKKAPAKTKARSKK
jgi:DNA topoisomerase-1